MRLYEFEGKQLFKKAGLPVPESRLGKTPEDVFAAFEEMKTDVVLKSQVLTGGRGKAGGIKFASGANEARTVATELFDLTIKGYPVDYVLVEPKLQIEKEFYLGVTIDRANYKLVVIGSGAGGVDIEETAAKTPDRIVKKSLDISDELYTFDALLIAKQIGVPHELIKQAAGIIIKLYNMFKAYDAKLVEINPLVLTTDGKLIAADSRVVIPN